MTLGIAMIGAGMVADTHARALADLADTVTVRGIYSRGADRRDALATRFALPVWEGEAHELIAREDVDLVLLLTPPNARAPYVSMAAQARKHVLMEKPIERNLATAQQLVELCQRAGVTHGVMLQHRFRESSQVLKTLLDEGQLGALCGGRIVVPWWRPQSYYDVPGRGSHARDGGGVLISQAIHTLDLAVWLLGEPASVMAMTGTSRLHRMESEDTVQGALRWANGALLSLSATTAHYPGASEYLALDFEQASVHLEAGQLTVRHQDGHTDRHGDTARSGGGADPMAFTHTWHRDVMVDMLQAIRQRREPVASGASALGVHRLIHALLASANRDRGISVADASADV
ncbi:Gfo/Idh/MocA family oxidoreductase [Oleiagrimonas sp. C23AA]|uniref:Gfo/Idh/MocA family protein n=1 Tax=Oleiagrimonas sp. C23AA TaxID=2719047 RepID=UPI0014219435|nr:Gfo/Idh/MocA family oxidoreductase [Oleiagrimonas sp. C23AA]NII09533.1 Gfo/Idh/MocA family oxidoreductase [Oleiagrimonas sp. C23AA]